MSDVNTAIDLTGEEYCNLKLVNNGSNVSLYMAVPEIPALIDHIYKNIQVIRKQVHGHGQRLRS